MDGTKVSRSEAERVCSLIAQATCDFVDNEMKAVKQQVSSTLEEIEFRHVRSDQFILICNGDRITINQVQQIFLWLYCRSIRAHALSLSISIIYQLIGNTLNS